MPAAASMTKIKLHLMAFGKLVVSTVQVEPGAIAGYLLHVYFVNAAFRLLESSLQ